MRHLKITVLLGLLSLGRCGEKSPQGAAMHLLVDAEIAALLPGLDAGKWSGAESAAVLANLQANYANWCKTPQKQAGLKRDLTDEELRAFKANDVALRTRLGCSSWHVISDDNAERDMAYTRNHFDPALKSAAHCVSVGFMQPYLMGVQFDCATLTVVDLSFRTLYLHAVLLPLLTGTDFAGIDNALVRWEKETGASLAEVCAHYGFPRCKIALMAFAEKYRGKLPATLWLAPLSKFRAGAEPTVVYMSNAVDPHFMNQQEFDTLRQHLAGSVERVYAIYHQAESSNFGLYELRAGKIHTVCADNFVVARAGRYSKDRCTYYPPSRRSFTTYFDDAAENRADKKTCQF